MLFVKCNMSFYFKKQTMVSSTGANCLKLKVVECHNRSELMYTAPVDNANSCVNHNIFKLKYGHAHTRTD